MIRGKQQKAKVIGATVHRRAPPSRQQMERVMTIGLARLKRWYPTTVTSSLGPAIDLCGAIRNDDEYAAMPGWWWLAMRYPNQAFLVNGRSGSGAYPMSYGVISEDECGPGRECSTTNGYSLGPFSGRSGIGLSSAPDTVAHELAHSLNSCHPGSSPHGEGWCYDSYPPFPNAHGGIGQWGFEIGATNVPTIYTPIDIRDHRGNVLAHNHDFMSYGGQKWVSGHQWRDLLEEFDDDYSYSGFLRGPQSALSLLYPRDVSTVTQRYLWVGGSVSGTQTVINMTRPFTSSPADLLPAPPDAPYTVRLLNGLGEVVSTARFDLAPLIHNDILAVQTYTHNDGPAHTHGLAADVEPLPFAAAISYPVEARSVVILTGTQVLVSRTLSGNAPSVTLLSPNGGEAFSDMLIASWSASDPGGDELTFELHYSTDGGESWVGVSGPIPTTTYTLQLANIAGSTNALLRVLATDGANEADDVSNGPFAVPTKDPSVLILSPDTNTKLRPGDMLVLEGMLVDLEDSATTEGITYTWTSNRDGLLGNEASVGAQLASPGFHTLTLTVTDRDGNSASKSVQVQVGALTYLPLSAR